MSPQKRPWLPTAIRAHEARKLDQLQRARTALDEFEQAGQRASESEELLRGLRESWAVQRRAVASDSALDVIYQRFHRFLEHGSKKASDTLGQCQAHLDAALWNLRQEHAVLRALERLAIEATAQRRQEARVQDNLGANEACVLRWRSQPPAVEQKRLQHIPSARFDARQLMAQTQAPASHQQAGSHDCD